MTIKKLYLIMILFPVLLIGQMDSIKYKKFAIGVNFSPDYSYRIDNTVLNSYSYTSISNLPKYGYTTGASLAYVLGKRMAIETGVFFSDKGQQTTNSISTNWITPNGTVQPPFKSKTNHHYYFIDIPVKANFYILTKRFKLYTSLGISTNLFLSKKAISKTTYSDGTSETIVSNNYNSATIPSVNFSGLIGIGVSYDINKKWTLKIEPVYRQCIKPITDFNISGYFYSFGSNFGVSYRF